MVRVRVRARARGRAKAMARVRVRAYGGGAAHRVLLQGAPVVLVELGERHLVRARLRVRVRLG